MESNVTIKIIAFTDNVTECDCCGKKGLKGTFCVNVDGNEKYFGSTCAFKKHGADENYGKLIKSRFETAIDWAERLSGKAFRYHNESKKSYDEIFSIIKPLALSRDMKAIQALIPSLNWKY